MNALVRASLLLPFLVTAVGCAAPSGDPAEESTAAEQDALTVDSRVVVETTIDKTQITASSPSILAITQPLLVSGREGEFARRDNPIPR